MNTNLSLSILHLIIKKAEDTKQIQKLSFFSEGMWCRIVVNKRYSVTITTIVGTNRVLHKLGHNPDDKYFLSNATLFTSIVSTIKIDDINLFLITLENTLDKVKIDALSIIDDIKYMDTFLLTHTIVTKLNISALFITENGLISLDPTVYYYNKPALSITVNNEEPEIIIAPASLKDVLLHNLLEIPEKDQTSMLLELTSIIKNEFLEVSGFDQVVSAFLEMNEG